MPFKNNIFDIVLTSEVLHEIKIFGRKGDLLNTFSEVKRILKPNGKFFILDHLDAGDGEIEIKISNSMNNMLLEFCNKFKYRKVNLRELSKNFYKTSKRDLQDFVTKTWSLNSPMEDIEMNESHNVFNKKELEIIARKSNFSIESFKTFHSIEEELQKHNITLLKEFFGNRKFLLILKKL